MAKIVEINCCEGIAETDMAVLVEIDGDQEVWVPKSQIHDDSEVYAKGHEGVLVVSEWFAEKEGLA